MQGGLIKKILYPMVNYFIGKVVLILEPGNYNYSNNNTSHIEEIHIIHDIFSINAGGSDKKNTLSYG